jgi:hypothetical protein
MDQKHTHLGDPTYLAYVHDKCRHPDCKKARDEYQLRLAQRKLNGEFVDLRKRQNRLQAVGQAYAEQHRPVIAGELPPGAPDEADATHTVSSPEPAQEPQTDPAEGEKQSPAEVVTEVPRTADDRVLRYLQTMCLMPGGKGKLNPNLLGMMPTVLQMSPEHCQAALDKLEGAGMLAGDGTDIYLVAA